MMSKSRSPLVRGLRVLYVLPLVCLGLGLQARTVYVPGDKDNKKILQEETAPEKDGSSVRLLLNLTADGTVDTGNTQVGIPEIGAFIQTLNVFIPEMIVEINAAPDVPMRVVMDLREELRKAGTLRINYTSPKTPAPESRSLPPADVQAQEKASPYPPEMVPGVNREDLCVALINANDRIFFEDSAVQDDAEILRKGTDFLKKHGARTHFVLRNDNGTSYGAYLHLQSLLRQIYDSVREETAQELYCKPMTELSPSESEEILRRYPLAITEAEPRR